MRLFFHVVRYKNLLSTGNAFIEIRLDQVASTLIIGPNGAGKSTFIEAICLALFNRGYRDVNKAELINTVNNRDCMVEVEFTSNNRHYKVTRGIKPSAFMIRCDGELMQLPADAKDAQEILEKQILKMTYKTFIQVVILGTAKYVPFMKLEAKWRREMIESLLDLQVWSVMNIILKGHMNANRESIVTLEREIATLQTQIHTTQAHIIASRADAAAQIGTHQRKVRELAKKVVDEYRVILEETDKIKPLQEKLKLKPLLETERSHYTTKHYEAENYAKGFEGQATFFRNNDQCPTCDQPIADKHKTKKIAELDNKSAFSRAKAHLIETKLTGINENLTIVNDMHRLVNAVEANTRVFHATTAPIKANIKQLEAEIKRLQKGTDSTTEATKDLERYTILKDAKDNEWREARILKEHLDMTQSLLKDDAIKGLVIKKYLPIINRQVNGYMAAMDLFIGFMMDENFEEAIKARHRDTLSYEAFSQGQKARIDLALLLTWRDIAKIKNSVATNLLILDEVFDGSLDAAGADELLVILKTLIGSNVFVISHKSLYVEKFNRVLEFALEKNFTKMITEQ